MKNLKQMVWLLVGLLAFTSCGDDDRTSELSFDKDMIDVVIGADSPTLITVHDVVGKLTFTAKEAIGSVDVVASVKDKNVIEVTGKIAGELVLVFKDEAGKTGQVKVSVLDPEARFIWDDINKREKIEAGIYAIVQNSENGKVTFSWTNNIDSQSIILTFIDESKKLETGDKTQPTLSINGKNVAVESISLSKKVVVKKGMTPTLWIKFKADGKVGICVATLKLEPI